MRVILKKDVAKLGSLGDEAEVRRGYARNFLIPQGLAVPLNRSNIKQIQHERQILAKLRADAISKHQEMARKLEDTEIVFTMKSGENGKLFGSITAKHIQDTLASQQIEIDRKKLYLATPIKTLGNHSVVVKLHSEVSANLEIKIVADTDTAVDTDEKDDKLSDKDDKPSEND